MGTESGNQLEDAHQFLIKNSISVPHIAFVRTKQLACSVLFHQKRRIYEWHEAGLLTQGETEELLHSVRHMLKHVEELRPVVDGVVRRSTFVAKANAWLGVQP